MRDSGNIDVPVLINGGGPTGIVLATELARRRVPFRAIDKMPGPAPTSRALTVHARTLEMFDRWDGDLLERFLNRGLPANGFEFIFKGEKERARLPFDALDTRYPYVLIHKQDETERNIRDYLRDKFGAAVEWNTRLTAVAQDEESVTVRLAHDAENGREEVVRTRWLVACDGIHSIVRKSLSLPYEGQDYEGLVLQNMDVTLEGYSEPGDRVRFYMGRGDFMMVAQLPGGNYRLLISDMGELADPRYTPRDAFQMIVDRHLDGVRLGEPDWASKWETWVRLAGAYRAGNVFLAGDAAHVHSPSGGQGMNIGMQDAHNLGWKLALAVNGKAAPEFLDTYERERQPIGRQAIEGASAIHEVFMGFDRDIVERIGITKDAEWRALASGRVSGTSYTYRQNLDQPRGLMPLDGPAIGDRAPDCLLGDGRRLFERLRHPDMTLCLMPVGDHARARDIADWITRRYGWLIRPEILDSRGDVAFHYGRRDEGRLYLIRPDGYIGFKSSFSEAARLEAHLDTLLTGARAPAEGSASAAQ